MSEPSEAALEAAAKWFSWTPPELHAARRAVAKDLADVIQRAIDVAVAAERERYADLEEKYLLLKELGQMAGALRSLPGQVPDEAHVSDDVPYEHEGVCQITPSKVDHRSADVENSDD